MAESPTSKPLNHSAPDLSPTLELATQQDGGIIAMSGTDYTVDVGRPDLDGQYSVVVPAGPGYIGFRASRTDYELTHDFPGGFAMLMNGFSMTQSGPYFHALEKIDAATENGAISLTMTARAGNVYEVRAVDSSDISIQNGTYVGLAHDPSWRRFNKGTFQIANLRAGVPRTVACLSADQKWAGAMIVKSNPSAPITIKANLAGKIKGRVVDEDGSPLSNVRILGSGYPGNKSQGSATTPGVSITQPERGETITDDDGKFVITGLIGGFHYELEGRVGDFFLTRMGQLADRYLDICRGDA